MLCAIIGKSFTMPLPSFSAPRRCAVILMATIALYSTSLYAQAPPPSDMAKDPEVAVREWLKHNAQSLELGGEYAAMLKGDPEAAQIVMSGLSDKPQSVENQRRMEEMGHDNIIVTLRSLLHRAAAHPKATPEMLILAARWHRVATLTLPPDQATAYDLTKKAREQGHVVDDLHFRQLGEYSGRLEAPFRAELVCGDDLPMQRCHTMDYGQGEIMTLRGIYSHGRQYLSGHPGRPTFTTGALTSDFAVELFNGNLEGHELTMTVFHADGELYAEDSAAPGETLNLQGPGF